MYDIAIVGAGPAGATLARLLKQQYKVLLIDRRQLDRVGPVGAVKSCGGLVAPDAQKVMATLGLGLPASVLVGPQLFVVRTIDLDCCAERYYQRFYINVNREKFDRWIASLIPDTVVTRYGVLFRGYRQEHGAFTLDLQQAGYKWTERARLLVAADGANSLIRRQALPQGPTLKRYIAIQERVSLEQAMPYFTAVFASSLTDFYGWTIPKDNQLLIGLAVKPGPEAWERFAEFKSRLQQFGLNFGVPQGKEGAFVLRPKWNEPVSTASGVALLGEAAGWISPSSAEGLSYAFTSAIMLADALQGGLPGACMRYERATRALRLNILGKNLKSPAMYHPLLRRLAMRSGLLSVKMHPGHGT